MDVHKLLAGEIPIPPLLPSRIDVWSVRTDLPLDALERLSGFLDADDRDRRDKFYFERDQRRFAACRGTLRLLLGAYQNGEPASIRFDYGPQGKPSVASPRAHGSRVRFNVSHSGDVCLLAFAVDREVGVDVEAARGDVNFVELAETVFSPAERVALSALPAERRGELFYEYWSCKEACIKADGRGLSVPLQHFSIVPFGERPEWRKVNVDEPHALSPRMRIRILQICDGDSAALAAEGDDWDVLVCG